MRRKIEGLPHGACAKVAREMGVSAGLVAMVARGVRRNARIEERLLREAKEHKNRLRRINRLRKHIC